MRGVSRWASRVAPLLAVLLVLGAASAWADEPPTLPTDPPGARMQPPVGLKEQARINPPVGVTTQARMQPPGGAPTPAHVSLLDTILIWLRSRM
jgi:hypothetical protein